MNKVKVLFLITGWIMLTSAFLITAYDHIFNSIYNSSNYMMGMQVVAGLFGIVCLVCGKYIDNQGQGRNY